MPCVRCGQPIADGDRFCRHCGTDQTGRPAPPPPPPPPAAPPGPPVVSPAGNPLASPPPVGPAAARHVYEPEPAGRSANVALIVGVVLLVLVLVGGMVVISRGGGSDDDEVSSASTTAAAGAPAAATIPPPPAVEVPPGGFTADQLSQTFGNAIWKVEVSGCGGEGHGSGFAISPRHVVTNWHVVVGDTEPQLVSSDGTRTISGHVIGLNQNPDVALIEVDEDLPNYVGFVDTANLVEGQTLVALGFPLPLGNYTVTQLAVASFEVAGENRTGILVDGKVDRGNSGGPSMTTDGKVAGINTSVNVNGIAEGGLQTVPYLTSYNAVRGLIDEFVKKTGGPTVPADCAKAGDYKKAKTYGDSPELDQLWDYCDQGDALACDALSQNATPQTDYYLFGVTCGGRVGREGYCTARYGPVLPPK